MWLCSQEDNLSCDSCRQLELKSCGCRNVVCSDCERTPACGKDLTLSYVKCVFSATNVRTVIHVKIVRCPSTLPVSKRHSNGYFYMLYQEELNILMNNGA